MTSKPGKRKISIKMQNLWRRSLLKQQLQSTCCPVSQDPFLKSRNWANIWINSLNFHTACFSCIQSLGLSKYIENKLQTTCFYLISSLKKNKKVGYVTNLTASFTATFKEKKLFLLCYINWPSFIAWLSLLCEIWSNMCIVTVC